VVVVPPPQAGRRLRRRGHCQPLQGLPL